MKNQLFKNSPDIKITKKILSFFGIKDMNDNHSFTRENLIELHNSSNLASLKDCLG